MSVSPALLGGCIQQGKIVRSTLPYLRVLAVHMRELILAAVLLAGVALAIAVGVGLLLG